MGERIADYRDLHEIPETCPVCGARIVVEEQRGVWHISGPADLANARQYGIETEGTATTIWLEWWCPVDFLHEHSPVALAG